MTNWLAQTDVPLFVSRTRLIKYKTLPRAKGRWALDSGGFTQLHRGGWTITPRGYVDEVRRFRDEIGGMEWAAPMDWMCEPSAREATGLSVAKHQQLTVENLIELRSLAPELPFVPVLQGYEPEDYLRCVDMYDRADIDLTRELRIGLGTVCRRQATDEIRIITSMLAGFGLKLHGFGVKILGLKSYAPCLVSADSMAWSYDGRRIGHACRHGSKAKNEANCLPFALAWRDRVLRQIHQPKAS